MEQWVCLECGKKFKTAASAEKAANDGCPKCGGLDIDIDTGEKSLKAKNKAQGGETKVVKFKGKEFHFHNPNGQGWTLYWSDGWEIVDEAAKTLGWERQSGGPGTYGHVAYKLKSLKTTGTKAMPDDLMNDAPMDNTTADVVANADATPLDDNPIADEGPKELYSAQVLRRVHEVKGLIMQEFDEMISQLEQEEVKDFLSGIQASLDETMTAVEDLFTKIHPDYPPIEGAMSKDMDAADETMPDTDTEDEESEPVDVLEADSDREEPLPTEDEVVEGMATSKEDDKDKENKSMKNIKTKDYASSVTVLVQNIKDYINNAKRNGTVGMSKTNLKQVVSTRGVDCATNEFDKAFDEAVSKVKVSGFDIYDSGSYKALSKKKEFHKDAKDGECKCGMPDGKCTCEKSLKKNVVPGDEENQPSPGEVRDPLPDVVTGDEAEMQQAKSLKPHHYKRIGGAVDFFKDLSTSRIYDEEHRKKAYHYAKALEETAGDLEDIDTSDMDEETKAMCKGCGTSSHKHYANIKDASGFLDNLSNERAFGESHREKAAYFHKTLSPVLDEQYETKTDAVPPEAPSDTDLQPTEDLPELGEVQEKEFAEKATSLKKTNLHLFSKTKQLGEKMDRLIASL